VKWSRRQDLNLRHLRPEFSAPPSGAGCCWIGLSRYRLMSTTLSGSISCAAGLGASSLSFHSFLDGLAIGVAFQAGEAIGIVVSVAVLIHDFSDGLNTVNVVIKNGGDRSIALRWLLVDAIAH
jgi:multidrug transporter EmrE-like cation transporter